MKAFIPFERLKGKESKAKFLPLPQGCHKGHYWVNGESGDMYCKLGKSIVPTLNILKLMTVVELCKKITLFVGIYIQILVVEGAWGIQPTLK